MEGQRGAPHTPLTELVPCVVKNAPGFIDPRVHLPAMPIRFHMHRTITIP
jgi:hypothetical protein